MLNKKQVEKLIEELHVPISCSNMCEHWHPNIYEANYCEKCEQNKNNKTKDKDGLIIDYVPCHIEFKKNSNYISIILKKVE